MFFLFWTWNAQIWCSTYHKFKEIIQAPEAAVRDASVSIWNIVNTVRTCELQENTLHDQDGCMWDKLLKVYLYPTEPAVLFLTLCIYMRLTVVNLCWLVVISNLLVLTIKTGKESLNKRFHFYQFVSLKLKSLHPIS